jgi:hypothetical protein
LRNRIEQARKALFGWRLNPLMDYDWDRLMIIEIGPAEGRNEERIGFLGISPQGLPRRKLSLKHL